MDSFIQADIFFFITAISVLVLTVFLGAVLFYVLSILIDIKRVTRIVRTQSELLAEDFSELREELKNDGLKLGTLVRFFSRTFGRLVHVSKKRRTSSGK